MADTRALVDRFRTDIYPHIAEGPARDLGPNPAEPQLRQIKPLGKDLDHPNRAILIDPVFQAFRKQRGLAALCPLNKTLHPIPRKIA